MKKGISFDWIASVAIFGSATVLSFTSPAVAVDTLYACFPNDGGRVRLVDSLSDCRSTEQGVAWNVQGPQGETGPAGPQGESGPPGPQGDTGPAGPQGPQGETGAAGAQGPQGETGPEGPQGPQGPQGDTGATGATGPQGPQGEVGPEGPAGPQGATGDQGPQGEAGASGPQGAAGPQGETGAQGPQGEVGPQGTAGPQGEIGPPGAQGLQGDVGPQGPQGFQGQIGYTGPQGPPGPAALVTSAQGTLLPYIGLPDGALVNLCTLNITTHGKPVVVVGTFTLNLPVLDTIISGYRILRDGAPVYPYNYEYWAPGVNVSLNASYYDAPSAGLHTYTVQVQNRRGNQLSAGQCKIFAFELG